MALINRVARLFRADMNAVLDRIEEPSIVLAEALREMEDSLYSEQKKQKLINSEHKLIATKLSSEESSYKTLQSEINLCIEADNEKLAKGLIRKRLQNSNHIKKLEQKSNTLLENSKLIEESIAEKQQTISEIREKAELFKTTEPSFESDNQTVGALSRNIKSVSDDEIEVEYLKLCHQKATTKKGKSS